MTFASLEFAALLVITFSLYYFLPQRFRMLLLLAASYAFYAYWNPVYAILIFASTVLDYAMALLIDRSDSENRRRFGLLASVLGNLGILAYFKYTDFALESLRALLGPLGDNLPGPLQLVLPVGISFYTFQTMSYTIDVYRRQKTAENDFLLVALYVCFFPQLVAGPIERARDLMPQLASRHRFDLGNVETGIRLIIWGLLKKIVVADRLTHAAYTVYLYPELYGTGDVAFAVAAMFVVIYLDFSAYTDIATGTARLFGITLSRNFDFPHVSCNIAEFWRRWHVTMSEWVRDYVFMPLGGFTPRNLKAHARTILITMGLVGLWHGAQWTFVLWGLTHGVCLIIYHVLHLRVIRKFKRSSALNSRPWRFCSWAFNTALRGLISILFFAPDLERAGIVLQSLFVKPNYESFIQLHVIFGFGVLVAFWVWHYVHFRWRTGELVRRSHPLSRAALYTVGFYVILFGGVEVSKPFIYYQF
jgi:alginate O-acetyltransferase complex protein AlgI